MQMLHSCSLIESVRVIFGLFRVILARFWVVMARSGSFWLVLRSYGSFWIVLADSIVLQNGFSLRRFQDCDIIELLNRKAKQ